MNKIILFFTFLLISFLSSTSHAKNSNLIICGGPSGGTFMVFADTFSDVLSKQWANATAIPTGGSLDNIKIVNSNAAQLGIAYAEDIHDALNDKTDKNASVYGKLMTAGFLYSAPVHIVVHKNSGIYSIKDLAGKKIGIGGTGSGSASSAEKVLSAAGIWRNTKKYYIGYKNAVAAFNNGILDGFWVYAGYPNPAVKEAAETGNIRLIDLSRDIADFNFSEKLPSMSVSVIPANIYKGVNKPVTTLSGSAVLITNASVPSDVVYNALKSIYSDESTEILFHKNYSLTEVYSSKSFKSVLQPMHPGAIRYWKEKGVLK